VSRGARFLGLGGILLLLPSLSCGHFTCTPLRGRLAFGGITMGPIPRDLTLLFIRRVSPTTGAREVLLGMKKRGFGRGETDS
jgi:hypothetical protein